MQCTPKCCQIAPNVAPRGRMDRDLHRMHTNRHHSARNLPSQTMSRPITGGDSHRKHQLAPNLHRFASCQLARWCSEKLSPVMTAAFPICSKRAPICHRSSDLLPNRCTGVEQAFCAKHDASTTFSYLACNILKGYTMLRSFSWPARC